ncbi:MAG: DUF1269 domain-containing protein [Desulfuromonadales bacterium]|nr:DUF1269 domain-containing protein [Desulfuromonadales bacterium]
MSELIVAGFKGEFTADEVLLDLLKMRQTHLIDLDYAVVAVRRADGAITVKNSNVLVQADTTAGCQWGIIIGGLAGLIIGGIIGAAIGESVKVLRRIGIKADFINEVSETLEPESSAIFIRVRTSLSDKVLDELKKFNAKLLRSSLTITKEAELIKELGKSSIQKETFSR